MAKTIYVVTHGDKFGGIDPHMTDKGFAQIRALRKHVVEMPAMVVCGTGRRHQDVAQALGFNPDRVTSVVGDGDSLDVVDGQKIVILTNGLTFALSGEGAKYTSLEDMAPAAKALVASLPNETVICAGRPLIMMLGKKDAKSAGIYAVRFDRHYYQSIEEVICAGEVDPALS